MRWAYNSDFLWRISIDSLPFKFLYKYPSFRTFIAYSLLLSLTIIILTAMFSKAILSSILLAVAANAQSGHVQLVTAPDYIAKPLTGFSKGSQPADSEGYNYCNMPHVNPLTYQNVSSDKYELAYVEVIHRHHKRTPYAANLVPTDIKETYLNYPQITTGGKIDSLQHGVDLFGVYNGLLGYIPEEYDEDLVAFRVTNNNITTQVFNSLVKGFYPSANITPELRASDNLEPNLSCAQADKTKSTIRSTDIWYEELNMTIYTELGEIFGINSTGYPSFFNSIDHFFDNLSSKTCAGDRVNVTEEQYETVIKLGHWEYDYTFRASENATDFGKYKYGNFTLDLVNRFEEVIAGERSIKYQHNIAHDGSIAGLTALIKDFLELRSFKWPGMGSEYVFELYNSKEETDTHYLRILYSGQEVSFTNLQEFIDYLEDIDVEEYSTSCTASS